GLAGAAGLAATTAGSGALAGTGTGSTTGSGVVGDALCAISSACARTPATRLPQPLPNVLQVDSPCRKESLSSHSRLIILSCEVALTAASVAAPMAPSCTAPTTLCRNRIARPGPLFTAKSKTA